MSRACLFGKTRSEIRVLVLLLLELLGQAGVGVYSGQSKSPVLENAKDFAQSLPQCRTFCSANFFEEGVILGFALKACNSEFDLVLVHWQLLFVTCFLS
jgi:hypothetical protein